VLPASLGECAKAAQLARRSARSEAHGYPTRGARRRREPTILACLQQTANAKATAMQERNYANGPTRTAPPLRRHRPEACDQPAPGGSAAPPAGRCQPRRAAGPGHRRRGGGHRRRPRHRRSSSRSTSSSPPRATRGTSNETAADGRGPTQPADHGCLRCRDSGV